MSSVISEVWWKGCYYLKQHTGRQHEKNNIVIPKFRDKYTDCP